MATERHTDGGAVVRRVSAESFPWSGTLRRCTVTHRQAPSTRLALRQEWCLLLFRAAFAVVLTHVRVIGERCVDRRLQSVDAMSAANVPITLALTCEPPVASAWDDWQCSQLRSGLRHLGELTDG